MLYRAFLRGKLKLIVCAVEFQRIWLDKVMFLQLVKIVKRPCDEINNIFLESQAAVVIVHIWDLYICNSLNVVSLRKDTQVTRDSLGLMLGCIH